MLKSSFGPGARSGEHLYTTGRDIVDPANDLNVSGLGRGADDGPGLAKNSDVAFYVLGDGVVEEIPRLLEEKYGDMLDEVLIYFGEPEKGDPETWRRLVGAFNESGD